MESEASDCQLEGEAQKFVDPLDVIVGVEADALTVTDVVPADDVQPVTVAVTEYVPAITVVEFAMVGFCWLEVNPFGPLHEYVAPLTVDAISEIVCPSQYGPPFEAVGAVGRALTTTDVDDGDEVQPFTVTVTEYSPPIAVEALEIVGFWRLEVKPFGPFHE